MIAAWLRRRGVMILALALVASCGASARQKAIRDTFVGVNVARASFVAWDANHQNVIIDSCVSDGNEEAECQRRLTVYRADRGAVVEAFTLAYRALAAASLDSHTPLPVVLGVVADLGAEIAAGGEMIADHLKGATKATVVAVLAGARAILGVLEGAAGGALSPDEAGKALTELGQQLASNDAAADTRLHERFDTGGKP